MSNLTVRQRTKINAALVTLHATGGDPNAVTAAAKKLIALGHQPAKSFEQAINQALQGNADLTQRVSRALDQIMASNDRTVAQYDQALSRFIQSGDHSNIAAVAPIATRDAVSLAVRNGELSKEDVAAGRIDWAALGMSAEAAQAAYDTPPPADHSEFAFAVPDAQPEAPAPASGFIRTANGGVRSVPTGERARREAGIPIPQTIVRTATGGYRGVMTGEKAARWHGLPMSIPATGDAPQPYLINRRWGLVESREAGGGPSPILYHQSSP